MTADEFRRLTHSGHGRAIVYAAEHDVSCFHDIIVDLCLHCRAYDPTVERTHAGYALDLLEQIPGREAYYDLVVDALAGSGDDYDAVKRFNIATCLATVGNARARRALYDHYSPWPEHGGLIALYFVDLDDMKGFLFVAAKIGEAILEDRPTPELDEIIRYSIKWLGEDKIREALQKGSATDPRIDAFRFAVDRTLNESKQPSTAPYTIPANTYAELKPSLQNLTRGRLVQWGKYAAASELAFAARELAGSSTGVELIRLLWIFGGRSYPLNPDVLFALLDSEDAKVADAAHRAIANVHHPMVRAHASRLIAENDPGRALAVRMLANNFEAGDDEVVLCWFEAEQDLHVQHEMDMLSFWAMNPDLVSEVRMLNLMYDLTPCTVCRKRAVERLIALAALTDEQRYECLFDASPEISAMTNPD